MITLANTNLQRNILIVILIVIDAIPICYNLAEGNVIDIFNFFEKTNTWLCIFPPYATTMFYNEISMLLVTNRPIILSQKFFFRIPILKLISIMGGSCFVFLFVYIILYLLLPRKSGSPPIGIRNLFSLTRWKLLFSGRQKISHDPSDSFIQAEHLTKHFNRIHRICALDDVSFSVSSGEVVVFIGPYSSGKSTLLNIISGCIDSEGGSLFLHGQRHTFGFRELDVSVGVCFQDSVFFGKQTVFENLRLFGSIRGVPKEEIKSEIDRICCNFDLTNYLYSKADNLSGGTKRKLCLAMSFIGNPEIVILDEPTAGVDVSSRHTVWKAISTSNTTCLLSSHMIEEAETISNRLIVLNDGKIIFDGQPLKLRTQYNCGYRLTAIFDGENEDDTKINKLAEFVKGWFPNASVDDIHEDTVLIPVDDKVAELLSVLNTKLEEFSIKSYNLNMMNVEDTLYNMYVDQIQ